MRKFWTVQNGKIGTAHINREGNLVDFREGQPMPRSHHNTGKIRVVAENNCVEPLELEFRVIDGWFDPNDWNHQFNKAGKATKIAMLFNGQEIELEVDSSFEIRMPITEEEKELAQKALKNRMEKERKEKEKGEEKDSQAIKEFEDQFLVSLTSQERRWLRRFQTDHQKARQELSLAIKARKGGAEFLRNKGVEAILELAE